MIKPIITAAIAICSFTSFGQTEIVPKTWRFASVGVEFGTMRDTYQKMNLQAMQDFTMNPALLSRDLTGFTENLRRDSPGSKMGINVTLSSERANNWSHEIRMGLFYSSREPMINFTNGGGPYSSNGVFVSQEIKSVIYCTAINEIALDGAYILRKTGKNRASWFSYYAGLGMNLGSSFNTRTFVIEHTTPATVSSNSFGTQIQEQGTGVTTGYQAKESVFTRLYVPIGVQATFFKRVGLGLESNIGVGMQSVVKGKSYFLPFNAGVTAKLSYSL